MSISKVLSNTAMLDHLHQGQGLVPTCGLLGAGPHSTSEASSAAPHLSPSLTLLPEPTPCRPHGKTVFHETSPWCQKVWGPLVYILSMAAFSLQWQSSCDKDNVIHKA